MRGHCRPFSDGRENGSVLVMALLLVAVSVLAISLLWARFDQSIEAQQLARGKRIGKMDAFSGLNIVTKLFGQGILQMVDRSQNHPQVGYSPSFTGQHWPLTKVNGKQTLTLRFCLDSTDQESLFKYGKATCDSTMRTVAVRFLSYDSDGYVLLVEAVVRMGKTVMARQTASINSIPNEVVPQLTCAYRMQFYDNSDHIYDQRGVVADNGSFGTGKAVRWNVAKSQAESGWPKTLSNVQIVLIFGGKAYRAGDRLPVNLDFSKPLYGQIGALITSSQSSYLVSNIHDLRTYFVDIPIKGVKSTGYSTLTVSGSVYNYSNINFERCETVFNLPRVNGVSFSSMSTYGGTWPFPY